MVSGSGSWRVGFRDYRRVSGLALRALLLHELDSFGPPIRSQVMVWNAVLLTLLRVLKPPDDV